MGACVYSRGLEDDVTGLARGSKFSAYEFQLVVNSIVHAEQLYLSAHFGILAIAKLKLEAKNGSLVGICNLDKRRARFGLDFRCVCRTQDDMTFL